MAERFTRREALGIGAAAAALALSPSAVAATRTRSDLDRDIEAQMLAGRIPGLAVTITRPEAKGNATESGYSLSTHSHNPKLVPYMRTPVR